MWKFVVFLSLLLGLVPEVSAAKPVTEVAVTKFKERLVRKYHRKDVPYVYLPEVVGRVNYPNLKRLERNWDKLSRKVLRSLYQQFKDAGLERFFWLQLQESAADPNRESTQGAIGLYQVMPGVAGSVCGLMKADLFDPQKNGECALAIMKRCSRFSGWQAQAICYNGKVEICPWKGYQKCLARKAKAGNHRVLESLHFPIKLLMFEQVGKEFFADDL